MSITSIPIVEIAISILISWALFSLLCSYVHEFFVQIKAERGRFLKEYLFKQLNDYPNSVNWASLLYLEGSIDLLSREYNKPTNDIDPGLFARSLINVVGHSHIVNSRVTQLPDDLERIYSIQILNKFKQATIVLDRSDILDLFQQVLADAEIKATGTNIVDEKVLYENLVLNLENWYKEFCERVSLWYKKITRQRLFMLGVVLATVLNIDTIELFTHFMKNASSSKAVNNLYQMHPGLFGNGFESNPAAGAEQLVLTVDSISKTFLLPIGIQENIFSKSPSNYDRDISSGSAWVYKILGLLISGFAASFGGPFWFEIIKKLNTLKK